MGAEEFGAEVGGYVVGEGVRGDGFGVEAANAGDVGVNLWV